MQFSFLTFATLLTVIAAEQGQVLHHTGEAIKSGAQNTKAAGETVVGGVVTGAKTVGGAAAGGARGVRDGGAAAFDESKDPNGAQTVFAAGSILAVIAASLV